MADDPISFLRGVQAKATATIRSVASRTRRGLRQIGDGGRDRQARMMLIFAQGEIAAIEAREAAPKQPPPDEEAARPLVEEHARDGVLFRRVFPPWEGAREGGGSHFGGWPRLPADLDWPRTSTGRPMPFLAAIELIDLPRFDGREALPAGGSLLFFADPYDDARPVAPETRYAGWSRVLLVEAGARDVPPREPPPEIEAVIGAYFVASKAVAGALKAGLGGAAPPRAFPRWAVEARVARTFLYLPPGFDDLTYDVMGGYEELSRASRSAAVRAAMGEPVPRWTPPAFRRAGTVWLPDDPWPHAWMDVATLAVALRGRVRVVREQAGRDMRRPDTDASAPYAVLTHYDAALAGATDWLARGAREAGSPFAAVPQATRREFRAWVTSLVRDDLAPINPDDPTGSERGLGAMAMLRIVADAFRGSTDALLGYAPGAARDLLSPWAVDTARGRHAPLVEAWSRNNAPCAVIHQVLGAAQCTAWDSVHFDLAPTHVLLAQFDTDEGMFWQWGDAGVLQFWITPDDLRARRFDRVLCA